MKLAAGRFNSLLCTLFLMPFVGVPALAGEPTQPKVNGTLSEIDGVPILRVWGTAEEQGFAQGFLLGPDIVRFLDGFLSSGTILDVEGYRNRILPRLGLMKIQPPYEAELRAMLKGIEARTGGPAIVSALERPIRYEDLAISNCMGDVLRTGCSSFAAWGSVTENGQTIAGRNMDWPTNPALEGSQIVTVRVPPTGSALQGWVSVFWPPLIGCTTGMNAEGVTVAMHDSNIPSPSTSGDFTSSTLLYREAIESARAETALEDITRI